MLHLPKFFEHDPSFYTHCTEYNQIRVVGFCSTKQLFCPHCVQTVLFLRTSVRALLLMS